MLGEGLWLQRRRWESLDFSAPTPSVPGNVVPATPMVAEEDASPTPAPLDLSDLDPALRAAWSLYRLGQFGACADLLTAKSLEARGAPLLLGMARGRIGEFELAVAALEMEASRPDPSRPDLCGAALFSAQLAIGRATIGAHHLPAELLGAASWRDGQQLLEAGGFAGAAQAFAAAGQHFKRQRDDRTRPHRQAAAYVGQAISLLLTGRSAEAARCYSVAFSGDGDEVANFARQVYELASAVTGLTEAERREAVAPLAWVVRSLSLTVGFYDGEEPLMLRWTPRSIPF